MRKEEEEEEEEEDEEEEEEDVCWVGLGGPGVRACTRGTGANGGRRGAVFSASTSSPQRLASANEGKHLEPHAIKHWQSSGTRKGQKRRVSGG